MTLYYRMRQIWSQNGIAILLQYVTKVYNKMRQNFYYKIPFLLQMQQLLQNATILLQNAIVITIQHVYYKLRQCIRH